MFYETKQQKGQDKIGWSMTWFLIVLVGLAASYAINDEIMIFIFILFLAMGSLVALVVSMLRAKDKIIVELRKNQFLDEVEDTVLKGK